MFTRFLTIFTFAGDRMRSFAGWTPGLRAVIRGRALPCGCVVGLYETHTAELAEVIDAAAVGCTNRSHRNDAVLWRQSPQAWPQVEGRVEVPPVLH